MTINLTFDPVLLTYGFYQVRTFGLFAVLGILVFAAKLFLEPKKPKNLSSDLLFQLINEAVIVAIFGARLFAIYEYNFSIPWSDFFKLYQGGLSLMGSVIALPIYFFIRLKFVEISFLELADFFVKNVGLLQAIARLGCFFSGCCVGHVSNSLLVVQYLHPNFIAPLGVNLFPAQLFMSSSSLIIFFTLSWLAQKKLPQGFLLGYYFIFEGASRFLIDFWRLDYVPYFYFFSFLQIIAAIFVAIGVLLVVTRAQ